MSEINLNNSEEYIKEIKIFNDGKAGIVDNVRVRIEKKAAGDADDKKPMYKLIAADDKSEINEGFYYNEADSKAFVNYQAQRLITLAKNVLGKDVKFPVFTTGRDALDGVMKMVAPALNNKAFRVVATYGTTKKPSQYLGFKSFGSFIQPMTEANTLALGKADNTVRAEAPAPTAASDLVGGMAGNSKDLDWMNK